ncbi:MAG: hypothetical protein ACO4AU_08855 [bacterium]
MTLTLMAGTPLWGEGLDYKKLREVVEKHQGRQHAAEENQVRNPPLDYETLLDRVQKYQENKPEQMSGGKSIYCDGCYIKTVLIQKRERVVNW